MITVSFPEKFPLALLAILAAKLGYRLRWVVRGDALRNPGKYEVTAESGKVEVDES